MLSFCKIVIVSNLSKEGEKMNVLDLFKLQGKVAIVTGGAQGLGKAICFALAEAGATIVIADIQYSKAEKVTKEISERTNVKTLAIQLDITDEVAVDKAVQTVLNEFGHIDILVNNAGIVVNEDAEKMSLKDWRKVMDVNTTAGFIVTKAVGNIMLSQGKGSVINISSMSGIIVNKPPQNQISYNVSKSGMIMLTKTFAVEWAKRGVRVNSIAPGYMKTEMVEKIQIEQPELTEQWVDFTPMGRLGNPEELGGIAVYLASDASSYTTGCIVSVDGGYTII
jgi:NAD(P)-dependent dehydrogenase (short-subunit alcohol dehydrogenase family)